jgi:hypothetical protein
VQVDPPVEDEAASVMHQRHQEFEAGMRVYKEKFFGAVSDAKPYVDYLGLLTANAVISALMSNSLLTFWSQRPERSLLVMVIAAFLYVKLVPHLVATSGALADMSLISLARLVRLPYPFSPIRSATVRWIYECYTCIALSAVVLGSGWVGYEIGQRTISALGVEIHSAAKAPDATKQLPKAAPTSPSP